MASLLNGVNEVMKRVKLIQGDSGELVTLTDSPRQVWIDQFVQIWNEVMEELYSVSDKPMPQELAEDTITLVTDDRDYVLSTFNTLHWPFVDETNGRYIYETNYDSIWRSQPIPADWTGLPARGAIRETDGQLYLDRIPTSQENGLVYKYRYDKDISMSVAADIFPFKGEVFRALIPVVAEIFKAENRKDALISLSSNIGRAARLLSNVKQRTSYGKSVYGSTSGIEFPFD